MALVSQQLDRLINQLNSTGLQNKDTGLYQVIKELIKHLKLLNTEINGISGDTIINETIIQQFLSSDDGGGGGDGDIGPPGPPGSAGAAGATGAAGPVTLGPMGLDADSPDEPWMIPGIQGPTGNTGLTGAQGPVTLGPMGLDGIDGEDGWSIPGRDGASGSSAGWSLITTITLNAATHDVINLSTYTDILVLLRNFTFGVASIATLRISTDNGASFLATTIYMGIAATGVETGRTFMQVNNATATAARSGAVVFYGFNVGSTPKLAFTAVDANQCIIAENVAFNALRIMSNSGNVFTGGTAYVLGR